MQVISKAIARAGRGASIHIINRAIGLCGRGEDTGRRFP